MEVMQSPEITEFAKALVEVQSMMQPAKKDKINPHYKSKYADFSSCWEALAPLRQHGFSVIQCPMPSATGTITLDTILLHTSGQWMRSSLTLPLTKHDPQAAGSAITYARRYALGCMTGLVTDEDDDANQASSPAPVQKAAAPQVHHPAYQAFHPDEATTFKWQIGKHKGKAIEELDLDYLIWAMENVKFQDHKDAARAEIDRRQAQDILQFEDGVEEING